MTFKVKSEYKYIVQVALFSQARKGHQWPGNGEAYDLTNSAEQTIGITCNSGEKICYGAWAKGNRSVAWGVGFGGTLGCENCCFTCNGSEFSKNLVYTGN